MEFCFRKKKAQVSIEYLIIVGFVVAVLIGILAIAFFYSGTIKDRIKMTQINNFANKIISTSESVFYAGEPSRATISAYLPENVKEIEIIENSLVLTFQASSGLNKVSFLSQVPISGAIDSNPGLKKIRAVAEETQVVISQV